MSEETSARFDRLPPHNLEAETCTIGSMMLAADARDQVLDLLPSREVFYSADHAIVFDCISQMHRVGKPVDAVLVREELTRRNLLEEIGGTAALGEMLESVPHAGNALHYAGIVLEQYRRREVIATCTKAISDAFARKFDADGESIAVDAITKLEQVRDSGGQDGTVTLAVAAREASDALRSGNLPRLLTGKNEGDATYASGDSRVSLDFVTGGFPVGGNTLVAGRPGAGKSLFVKDLAINWARDGTPVGIVTIEENRRKIANNALSGESGVENWKIERVHLSAEERGRLDRAVDRFEGLPLYIDDTASTIDQVENSIRRMVKKYRCRVVIVDHLHLIQSVGKVESRNQEVTKLSARIKTLYRRLNVVGITCCQLNRSNQDGENSVPSLTSLRDSGSLEQDGDVVVLLHRRDYYREDPSTHDRKLEAHVAKNKAGMVGPVWLYFDGDHQAIYDWNGGRPPTHPEDNQQLDFV